MENYEQILWAFMIGVTLAAVYVFFVRRVLGGFVKKLLDHNAFTPETAVTLEEVGQKPGFLLMRSLRRGTDFSGTVAECEGRYYIPRENLEKAENKYKNSTGGVAVLLVSIAVFAAVTALCIYAFPQLLEMVKNLFGENG